MDKKKVWLTFAWAVFMIPSMIVTFAYLAVSELIFIPFGYALVSVSAIDEDGEKCRTFKIKKIINRCELCHGSGTHKAPVVEEPIITEIPVYNFVGNNSPFVDHNRTHKCDMLGEAKPCRNSQQLPD